MEKKDYGIIGLIVLLLGSNGYHLTADEGVNINEIPINCNGEKWYLQDVKNPEDINENTAIISESGQEARLAQCIPNY